MIGYILCVMLGAFIGICFMSLLIAGANEDKFSNTLKNKDD